MATFDDLHKLVLMAESSGRDFDAAGNVLTSPVGAKGRMQVMDATNRDPGYGVAPAADDSLEERARVGKDYLQAMLGNYGGDVRKALAAYNAGPGNVDKAIAKGGDSWMDHLPKPQETVPYVNKIVSGLTPKPSMLDNMAAAVLPAARAGSAPQNDKFADIFADTPRAGATPAQEQPAVAADPFADIFADTPRTPGVAEGRSDDGALRLEMSHGGAAAAQPPVRVAPQREQLDTDPSAGRGGIGGALFMGAVRDPLDAGAQLLARGARAAAGVIPDSLGGEAARRYMDEQVSDLDKQIRTANREYDESRELAGRDGMDIARGVGNVASPANIPIARMIGGASTLGQLAARGAAAGAAGSVMQPVVDKDRQDSFGGTKLGQAAVGAAAGAVLTPVMARATEAIAQRASSLLARLRGPSQAQIDAAMRQAAQDVAGADASQLPESILQRVRQQVAESLAAGRAPDAAALLRRAEFEELGMQPTLGQITRDPMQFARERNLRGVDLGGGQNPLASRFADQNQQLVGQFEQLGAGRADSAYQAGSGLINQLRAADEPVQDAVSAAYRAARGADGRYADLNTSAFSERANGVLDEQMLGRFLPEGVRGMMNDVASGRIPLNVNNAVQFDSVLSEAQRAALRAGNRAEARAVGVVRDALNGTPLIDDAVAAASGPAQPLLGAFNNDVRGAAASAAPDAAPGGIGAAARQAFDDARALARDRFATIEQTPALKAALDGADPDTFVRKFILGGSTNELRALRDVLQNSPEAVQQVRSQIAEHLRQAAFGPNASGDTPMAVSRYMSALQRMGRDKLETFFSPEEVQRLMSVGRVGQFITTQPAGAAVNNSNTASAAMNLLAELSGPVGRIPGVRLLRDQVRGWQNEMAAGRALSAQPGAPRADLPPEVMNGLRALFPLAPIAGGVAGGSLLK
ncbi:MAG: lytic transglycosylase domain-containing protein [Achromobacter sp.]|uniref:lytic transglycosylase domain-containing protein n=1 Tax=Achromobacter sp. TaxID=134375 RepID=UPI001AC269BF|nr:lytic transglycosylase domain-containing protein [Achromobacter sp.]MBN9642982.1 lytic transglycosylase domain-containing protein [Achromobacter sp.]